MQPVERRLNLLFFLVPLRRPCRPKGFGDFAVQFVEVGLLDATTCLRQPRSQPLAFRLGMRVCATRIMEQRLPQVRENIIRNMNIFKNLAQPIS